MGRRGTNRPPQRGTEKTHGAEALWRLAAALTLEDEEAWRLSLRAASRVRPAVEIDEVLLQSHLFIGFPAVLNAFIVWREEEPRSPTVETSDGPDPRIAGEALCRLVYGRAYDRLRDNVRRLHPDLDRWMVEHGYGKTLSRPALAAPMRELCIVAQLTAAGSERQLHSHLRGALNVGATVDEVEAALRVGLEAADRAGRGAAHGERVRALWQAVRSKHRAKPVRGG